MIDSVLLFVHLDCRRRLSCGRVKPDRDERSPDNGEGVNAQARSLLHLKNCPGHAGLAKFRSFSALTFMANLVHPLLVQGQDGSDDDMLPELVIVLHMSCALMPHPKCSIMLSLARIA